MDENNRRKAPRFDISQLVELSYGRERWVHARGVDMSAGGFRAVASESIDIGASMEVMLRLGESSINVEAFAIHVDKNSDDSYEVGFQFLDVDPSVQTKIDAFLESLIEDDQ